MHAALFIAVLGTVPVTAYFEANPKIIEDVPIYNYDLARLARVGNSPHNHASFLEMMQEGGNAPEDEDDIEWIIEMKDGSTDAEVDAVCKDKAAHGCLSEGHPDKSGIPVAGVKATVLGLTKLLAAHKGEVKHVEPNLPIYLPPNEADHIVVESKKKTQELQKQQEEEEDVLLQLYDGKDNEFYVMRHIMADFVVGEKHGSMKGALDRFEILKAEGNPCVVVNGGFRVVKHAGKNSALIMKDFQNWWEEHTGKKPDDAPAPTKAPKPTKSPAPGKAPKPEEEEKSAPRDTDTRRRRISTHTDAWGLDRIDAETGLDSSYESTYDGKGVHVYVLDTGIKHDHTDFMPVGQLESHAETTLEMWGSSVMPCTSKDDVTCAVDRFGHGTHCAGSVGGEYSGVAKGATIHGVKVLGDDGKGSDLGVAMAIDWIMTNGKRPAILSMSLGRRGKSATMADVLDKAIDGGLTVVVAAGNEAMDACGNSPAFVEKVITVAATTNEDAKADFSNYGSCVDIFAPGKSIRSAYFAGAARFATMSGTSMACPHVSGFAALVLQANPTLTPAQVKEALLKDAIKDKMLSTGPRSPDLMLHVKKNPSWGKGAPKAGDSLESRRRKKKGEAAPSPQEGDAAPSKRRRRGKGAKGTSGDASGGSKRRRRGKGARRRRKAATAPPA